MGLQGLEGEDSNGLPPPHLRLIAGGHDGKIKPPG